MQPTAAVEAGVDDDGLPVAVASQQLGVGVSETGAVHACHVDIADLPVGELVHHILALFDPALVKQVVQTGGIDGFDVFVPLFLFGGVVDGDAGAFAGFAFQQREVIFACLDFAVVDFADNHACLDFIVRQVEGTAGDDLGDFQSVARMVRVEECAQSGSGSPAHAGTVSGTRMGSVQLAQHFA